MNFLGPGAVIQSFHQENYLFGIAWLWILIDDFKCRQSKGLDEEMLVDNVPSLSCTICAKFGGILR